MKASRRLHLALDKLRDQQEKFSRWVLQARSKAVKKFDSVDWEDLETDEEWRIVSDKLQECMLALDPEIYQKFANWGSSPHQTELHDVLDTNGEQQFAEAGIEKWAADINGWGYHHHLIQTAGEEMEIENELPVFRLPSIEIDTSEVRAEPDSLHIDKLPFPVAFYSFSCVIARTENGGECRDFLVYKDHLHDGDTEITWALPVIDDEPISVGRPLKVPAIKVTPEEYSYCREFAYAIVALSGMIDLIHKREANPAPDETRRANKKKPADNPDLSYYWLKLRESQKYDPDPDGYHESLDEVYSHSYRYLVRGHWRHYDKPLSDGRTKTWVRAHVRGPQERPLRLKGYDVTDKSSPEQGTLGVTP